MNQIKLNKKNILKVIKFIIKYNIYPDYSVEFLFFRNEYENQNVIITYSCFNDGDGVRKVIIKEGMLIEFNEKEGELKFYDNGKEITY